MLNELSLSPVCTTVYFTIYTSVTLFSTVTVAQKAYHRAKIKLYNLC